MKINAQFWTLFTWRSVVAFIILPWFLFVQMGAGMKLEKRRELRDEAKDMFYHGYRAYMENAYPADELMPLTCKGRWRDTESRGDVDDVLGNFSLTLIDSLDTLVVLGDFEEFEHGIREVIKNVHFDHDIVVSVFETNIRVLGGLLSAHALATYLQQRTSLLPWYKDELLTKAQDLGYRLLPAFNTTTGIPYSRINLRHGVSPPKLSGARETCTACAGTMILELAALSRLSGEPIFEEKGHKAMDALWSLRHRSSDLMGTVLNIDSGDWIRRDSGVGAGIDSYYEYCLKAYVLLGDDRYLERFNKHYSAVMRYISQGPMLLDVHMHRPHTNSKNFMDSLLAFWPGLQVLKGDLKPAVETHEMLYQVMQRHNFLPEAFTTDFQVHWGQHPLRPEFVESTYFLYRATGDPYYLEVGEKVLRSLQKYARVPCGYAAVKDVRTGQHEDRMDSFVLAETFKYLYLLFAEPEDLPLRLDDFVFTTEGHLFPLSLARLSNLTAIPLPETYVESPDDDVDHARSCPSAQFLFPGPENSVESIRKPLKNFVDKEFRPVRKSIKRNLRAHDFQAGNAEHMQLLKAMGITIVALPDGRVQLLHTFSNAHSAEDAEEGLMFMQEMVELSRSLATQPENPPKTLTYTTMLITHTEDGLEVGEKRRKHLKVGPAQFGLELIGDVKVSGFMAVANPVKLCSEADNAEELRGKIVYVERGDCMFIDKARRLQRVGALGGIVGDNQPAPVADAPLFAMSGDGEKDVNIPMVFMYKHDAWNLLEAFRKDPTVYITLSEHSEQDGFGTAEMARIDEEAPTLPELPQDATHEALKVNIEEFVRQHSHEAETRAGGSEGSKRQTVGETYIIRLGEDGQLMTEKIPVVEQGQGLGTISRIERLADGNSEMESAEEKMSTTNPTWQHEKGSRASKDNTLTSQAKGEAVPVTAAKYELPSYWESKTASEDLGIHASSGPSKTSLSDRKYLLQMVRFSLRTLLSLEPELNQVKNWKASSKEDLQELGGLASDLRSVVIEVFESQRRSLKDGIARKHTDGYESSFKLLWPTFPWPNTYLEEMIFLLQSVARDREFEPEDKPLINDVTLLNKLSKLLEESEGQSRVDSGEHKGAKETGLTKEELENLRSLHPDLLDIPDDENALRRKAKKLLVAALIGKTRKEHRQKAVRRRRKSESTDLPMPKLRPGDEL